MRKRLTLFVIGFVLAMAAFVTYQYVTDARMLTQHNPPPQQDVIRTTGDHSQTFEFRSRTTGELKYIVTAKSAVLRKDANGNNIPGEYDITDPEATFYSKDGRNLHLRADKAHIVLDQLPKVSAPAAGDTDLPPFQVRVGTLSGHVRLTMNAKLPADSGTDANGSSVALPPKPEDSEVNVTFDDDVQILQNQNLLTSPGAVHVRSDAIEFDGAGLNLSYNRDAQRIEFLRIDKGDKVILRKVGKQAFSLDANDAPEKHATPTPHSVQTAMATSGPAAGHSGAATSPSPSQPAATQVAATHPAIAPTTYRLSFGKSVVATLGGRSLTSDRLYALFMPGNANPTKSTPPKTATAVDTSSAGTGAPPTQPALAPASVEPSAPTPVATPTSPATAPSVPGVAGPDDLVINWTGPMEMRPAGPGDVQLVNSGDSALEAVGTVESPVILRDGTRTVTAGRLWYHKAPDRVEIEPGDLRNVQLTDPAQGILICQGVSLLRAEHTLTLAGPGTMEVPQSAMHKEPAGRAGAAVAEQTPLRASWTNAAKIDFVLVPDLKSPARKTQAIRRAVLTGDVSIKDIAFQLNTDALDLLIASTGDAKTPQALEHLLADGNVRIKYARPGASLEDADKPEGMTAKQLEVFTSPRPGTNIPVADRILATGDVEAWTYSDQKEEASATPPPTPPAALPAAAGGKAQHLLHQTLYTPRLDVALEPKEKNAAADAGNTFALGSGSGMKSLLASQGVKVEIDGFEGAAGRLVVATAQTLAADKSGRAVLDGDLGMGQPNGKPKPVLITQGDNQIIGDHVTLDQKAHSIEIPGPGTFSFVEPGKKGEADSTVEIRWTKKMLYDDKAKIATFTGHIESSLLGKPDQSSEMTCEQLLKVTLYPGHAPGGGGEGAAANDAAGKLNKLLAQGDVRATGITYEPGTRNIATKMALRTNEVQYNADTTILNIPGPGNMTIEDYRVDKASRPKTEGPDSKGITVFVWEEKLSYFGQKGGADAGTIHMIKNVRMKHLPIKAFQLPGADAKAPPVKEVYLSGQSLIAHLAQAKEVGGGQTVSSPVGLGSGGDMKLSSAIAEGNARLDLGDDGISGNSLEFDAIKKLAIARGNNGIDAQALRPGQAIVSTPDDITWDLATNSFKIPHPRGSMQLH